VVGACGPSYDRLARETAPPRFALDMTVVASEELLDRPAEPPPRARRPARYIVEPDGGLHAGQGRGVDPDYYPPLTRRLTRDQMNELWRAVRDSAIPAAVTTEQAGAGFGPSPGPPVAKLGVILTDQWLYVRTPLDGATPHAEAVEDLADRLAALAWVGE